VRWIQRYRIGHSIAFVSGSCSLAATVAGGKQRGTLSKLLLAECNSSADYRGTFIGISEEEKS
jgi:hypothetical protein